MGGKIPKQYLMLGGMPILMHTLLAFQEAALVDAIYLVVPPADVPQVMQNLLPSHQIDKIKRILTGGERRQDSVKNGIDLLDADCDLVVVHDGVRPLVSPALINAAVTAAARLQAVTTGLPVTDTVKKVDAKRCVTATVSRDSLWLTQTPQVFAASLLKKAYAAAYADQYYGTDDASLVERIGGEVHMIMGAYDNMKITTAADLEWGELFLNMRQNRNGTSGPEPPTGERGLS